jgi:hypothetical protein
MSKREKSAAHAVATDVGFFTRRQKFKLATGSAKERVISDLWRP